jgi:tetratricopeptide (TPR) repeat protein
LISEGRFQKGKNEVVRYQSMNREDPRSFQLLGELEILQKNSAAAERAFGEALTRGQWNDLGILRGYLQAVQGTGERAVVDERLKEFEALIEAYSQALVRNTHFIDLSHNLEEFLQVARFMAEFYPEKAPHYQVLAARVDRHVREERTKLRARPGGYLW